MKSKNLAYLALTSVGALMLLGGCATPPPREASYRPVSAPPAAPPPPQQVYFYATKGQTPEQVDRDRFECHEWAVKQSGFDPSMPAQTVRYGVRQYRDPAPGRDTATGVIAGAAIGAIAAGPRDAGTGAVVGAVAGAVLGSAADQQRQTAIQQANDARIERAQQLAQTQDARQDSYRRALAACGAARGYDVR